MMQGPDRTASFTVFAQQPKPALDVAKVIQQASRFFEASLSVEPGKIRFAPPFWAAVRLAVEGEGARTCAGRLATEDDLAAAEQAEARAGFTGMALLAKRCPVVWLVATESSSDMTALRIATILASVLYGPILDPAQAELFGVNTGRKMLPPRSTFR